MKATIDAHGIRLQCRYEPAYSFASLAAGRCPVQAVTYAFTPGVVPRDRTLTLNLPEIEYHETVILEPGAAGEWKRIPRISRKSEFALEGTARGVQGHLVVEVDGQAAARLPVTILPSWQWAHTPDSRAVAAAYVLPGDQIVSRTIIEASSLAGNSSLLTDLARTDPLHAAARAMEALYVYLSQRCNIIYETPYLEIDEHTGISWQRVRGPDGIFFRSGVPAGGGNCFDLTLFLAGCLESLGLDPLILFLGSLRDAPSHAFLGCWNVPGQRFRPLLTDGEALAHALRSGDLLALESTGVCRGARALAYPEAVSLAAHQLTSGHPVHALDVSSCRPPVGGVRPVMPSNAPEVQRAFWAGHGMARDHGAKHYETLHILYGLCAEQSSFTSWVLERSGTSARRVREIIERMMTRERRGRPGGPPVPTVNHDVCITTSRATARGEGRSTVGEADLLWAVLQNPSRNVSKVLDAAGCNRGFLARELGSFGEHSIARSVSRSLTAGPPPGIE